MGVTAGRPSADTVVKRATFRSCTNARSQSVNFLIATSSCANHRLWLIGGDDVVIRALRPLRHTHGRAVERGQVVEVNRGRIILQRLTELHVVLRTLGR